MRLLAGLAMLWLLMAIVFFSDAACHFLAFVVIASTGFGLGVAWLAVAFNAKLLGSSLADSWCWVAVPCAGVLGLGLALTDDDLALRVWFSESALKAYVDQTTAEGDTIEARRVGLFTVESTLEHQGAVFLYTSYGFLDRNGVAYIPNNQPLPSRKIWISHLYGPWFVFTHRF